MENVKAITVTQEMSNGKAYVRNVKFAPLDEVRKNLEDSGDVHLQAIARLDSARLAKLAEWIRSLDKI